MSVIVKAAQGVVNVLWSAGVRAPKGKRSSKPQMTRSGFESATIDRLTADWTGTEASIDETLKKQLPMLRKRARDLAINNDYAKRYLALVRNNVIGPNGIQLQSRVTKPRGAPDDGANRQIESAWKEWSKPGVCTVDGGLSWIDAQCLFVESVARDGECLVRKITGPEAGNDFGFALQFIDIGHLEVTHNRDLGDGRRIHMGIEIDKFGRPIAYHLSKNPALNAANYHLVETERVPASEIIHGFQATRPGQSRGFPALAVTMTRLKMLGAYEEAEVIAARIGASKMGFYQSGDADGYEGDGEDEVGNLMSEVEPGALEQLPDGVTFQAFDPQHPTTAFGPFIKTMLRGAASGLGVSYNSLANDLEGVNFSSIRQGALEERDQWRGWQRWASETLHGSCFPEWLKFSLLYQKIGAIKADRLDDLNKPTWQPRGWQWVDPAKEIKAHKEAVDLSVKSRSDIAREQGRDFVDTVAELAREKEILESAGLLVDDSSNSENEGLSNENDKNE
jgi:lambda family phage portal protein